MRNLLIAFVLALPLAANAQVITPAPSGFLRLYSTGVSVGNGADTNQDTLQTYTMAAGQLANVGDVIHIRASGTLAASTDSKTVRVNVGGQLVASVVASAALNTVWTADVVVIKTGSNTQSYSATTFPFGASAQLKSGTLTLTDTSALTIQVTGQNSTNPVAGSVTCQITTVDYEH